MTDVKAAARQAAPELPGTWIAYVWSWKATAPLGIFTAWYERTCNEHDKTEHEVMTFTTRYSWVLFFFFLISAGRICSRNAENIILVPYLPTQIKTLIYLRKPEEMKLCCPKQICPPHTGGNISLCCSSRGAHENTFQVTPLTQAMLSTFHYYSPQVDRFTDKNVPICLYLLMLATHRKAWATKILCFYNIE